MRGIGEGGLGGGLGGGGKPENDENPRKETTAAPPATRKPPERVEPPRLCHGMLTLHGARVAQHGRSARRWTTSGPAVPSTARGYWRSLPCWRRKKCRVAKCATCLPRIAPW